MKLQECEIINIRKFKSQNKEMCDIEVEDNHNFFANGILTHNSATAFRDDGNDMMLTATTGPIVYSLKGQSLIDQGYLMKPDIYFLDINQSNEELELMNIKSKKGLIKEIPEYSPFYSVFIVDNEKRNNAIKTVCDKYKDKTVLILVKLVEHGKKLEELIPGSVYVYGESPAKLRTQSLKDFKEGELKILISMVSIFAEGVDIPTLDIIINAASNKGDIKSIQILGRVLRKHKDKDKALYFDFDDKGTFFWNATQARIEAFRKEGHNVSIKKIEDL